MDEYAPNSHKFKEEEKKKVEKVVSGKVTSKKKSEVQKFADIFISEDVANVKNYILLDVLVPAIKKAISDIVTNGIDMILYGDSGRGKKTSAGSKVSYGKYYESERNRDRASSYSNRSGFDYDESIFETRGDAELVLSQMEDVISQYDFVSIADLYDLADLKAPYTSAKYGWTSLRTAEVVRERGGSGYTIKLPKAMPLDI